MAFVKKFKLAFIIAGVMVAEGVALMLLMPSSSSKVQAEAAHGDEHSSGSGDMVEHKLGDFKVNNITDPVAPLKVDFTVVAVVGKEHDHHFAELIKARQFRIKEAVATVVRKASHDAIQEPSLSTIKRQIKEAVGEIVGKEKDHIEAIVIPEFKASET